MLIPAVYYAHCFISYENDLKLQANLNKAHKVTYRVVHPGNNKQNASLALALFQKTTYAAILRCCQLSSIVKTPNSDFIHQTSWEMLLLTMTINQNFYQM